jgi:hypothetical protein
MQSLAAQLPGQSQTFTKQLLRIAFKFAGEPQTEDIINNIYQESLDNEIVAPPSSSEQSEELP